MTLFCLHGFLGHPIDWTGISHEKPVVPNIFEDEIISLQNWSESFNKKVERQVKSAGEKSILMGYSMGGRLALHALINHPDLYNAAIIISASYGVEDPEERERRYQHDINWSNAFLSESWDSLLERWNGQPIFQYDKKDVIRLEKDYSRKALSDAMRCFSIGKQEFLKEKIEELDIPILWVVGERDTKYVSLAKNLRLKHPDSSIVVIPNAGHRLHLTNPETLQEKIGEFILLNSENYNFIVKQ